jgi:choline dehydrogenase-like flavoprotein
MVVLFPNREGKCLVDPGEWIMNGRVLVDTNNGSGINGMMCTYSSKEDIDSWAKLGNPGWTHDDLAPYYKKFETFTEPSIATAKFYHTAEVIDEELRNGGGPIRTSFAKSRRVAGNAWIRTFDGWDLKMSRDPQSGFGNGGYR